MVDLQRGSSGVYLPAEIANEVWAAALQSSVVVSLSTELPLPGAGVSVDLITADPVAAYVAETAAKPVSNATVGAKTLKGYKIAVISTFSDEMVRDKNTLYENIVKRMPAALAKAFDLKVLTGTSPGAGHDVLSDATALEVDGTGTYGDLLAVRSGVSGANGRVDGWLLSPALENTLLGAVDGQGRPLLMQSINTDNGVGNLFGAKVIVTDRAFNAATTPDTVGFAGQWFENAYYGTVEGVKITEDRSATVGGVNLFEQNMVAVRAEIEIGFAVRDKAKFRRLTVPA